MGRDPAIYDPEQNALARIGGKDRNLNLNCVESAEYIQERESEWKLLRDMNDGLDKTRRKHHAVAVLGHKLFVAGGWNERDEIVGTMFCLHLIIMHWQQFPDMGTKRQNPIGCGFKKNNEEFVLVAGGWHGDGYCLRNTEIYDLKAQRWESPINGNMNRGREEACAVKFREEIWMMGGWDDNDSLNSCEIFSIEQRIWNTGPEMNKKRSGPSATVANGTIYVAGGYSGNYESSVEYCNPLGRNMQWTIMEQRMNVPRENFGLGSIGESIYAVGGENNGEILDSVEVLEMENGNYGEWKVTAPLKKPVSCFGGLASFEILSIRKFLESFEILST